MGAQLRRQVQQGDAEIAAVDERPPVLVNHRLAVLDHDAPRLLDLLPVALALVGADGARRSHPGRESEGEAPDQGVETLSIAHCDVPPVVMNRFQNVL